MHGALEGNNVDVEPAQCSHALLLPPMSSLSQLVTEGCVLKHLKLAHILASCCMHIICTVPATAWYVGSTWLNHSSPSIP